MGEEHGEQIDLVPDPGAGGNIIELIVGFKLGEEAFLCSPAIVEGEHLAGAEAFVGEDDLELIAELMGE